MTKVAVIGAGAMGRNHARVYSEIESVQLVGVADIFADAAEKTARRFGTVAYTDYLTLLDEQKPEAVTIAVPTIEHLNAAKAVAERGIHMLIEKPIAFSVAEGQEIIDTAAKHQVVLTIGHIERFNPAVVALKQHLAQNELGRIFQIDARRQGPFPARIYDVGVVIDLAVHDLDIIRYVTGSEIVRLYAETERRIHGSHEDLFTGLVRLKDGIIGTLMINWLTPTKIRELTVTGERGMFRVDYLTQDLYFFENAIANSPDWQPLNMLRGVSEGRMIRYAINKREPLRAELEAFLAAVRGETPPAVSGHDGLKALGLAQAVVASGVELRVINFQ
jgi:predicted dehydrogenase